jgi:stage III sporulation protein AD
MLKIAVICVAGAVLLLVLKKYSPEYTLIIQATLIIFILLSVLPEIKNIMRILSLSDVSGFTESTSFAVMLKAAGILTIGSVVADVCRDNGESGIGGMVELSAKILMLSAAAPVLEAVIEAAMMFLGGM